MLIYLDSIKGLLVMIGAVGTGAVMVGKMVIGTETTVF
jgi:hypothetical protein